MRRWIILAVIGCIGVIAIGTAFGTPGTPALRHAVTIVTGIRMDSIKTDAITPEGKKAHIKLETREPTNVVTQEITYQPGGTSGWHHHPGVVVAVVKSGQFKFYEDRGEDGCIAHTYNPGDVFVESGTTPGNLRNESAAPAVVAATFIVPLRSPSVLRLDDGPHCGVLP